MPIQSNLPPKSKPLLQNFLSVATRTDLDISCGNGLTSSTSISLALNNFISKSSLLLTISKFNSEGMITTLMFLESLFLGFSALSVQFSSVAQSCRTLCDLMNRSTPGLPVHHQLPEFTQTRVHPVSDAIQPSHPPSSPSPPAPNPSQHQSLFQ